MIDSIFCLLMGGGCILSISPCQPLYAHWVPLWLSKQRLSNTLSQHQSNSQVKLSKPTNEDFKISKRRRTRSLSEYIPIYQSSLGLQCDFCIPNDLVTRPVTKGRASPSWKTYFHPEKIAWAYCMHDHGFRTCYRCKIWPPSENSSPPWCPKLLTDLLVTVALWLLSVMPLSSVFSQSNFSDLTSNFNRRN